LKFKILKKLRTASFNSELTGSYKKSVCYFSVVQIIKSSQSLTDIVIFKFLNPLILTNSVNCFKSLKAGHCFSMQVVMNKCSLLNP